MAKLFLSGVLFASERRIPTPPKSTSTGCSRAQAGKTAQAKEALSPSLRMDVPEDILNELGDASERVQPGKKYIMISQWRYYRHSEQVRNLGRELLP
jgi:hypothetical protein